MGLTEYRRIVRQSESTIVLSKFEPGFSQDLFAVVELLPELFDDAAVLREYQALVRQHISRDESPLRTAVWREASESLLVSLGDQRGVTAHQRMLVLPGIESAQAVLDIILWSAPTIADACEPRPGEVEAYREFEARLSDDDAGISPGRDIFTRYYGVFEGRRVENHCPGATYARRLVAQAWSICTCNLDLPPLRG